MLRGFQDPIGSIRLTPPASPKGQISALAPGRDGDLWLLAAIIGNQRLKEISVTIGNSEAVQGPANNGPASLRKRTLMSV